MHLPACMLSSCTCLSCQFEDQAIKWKPWLLAGLLDSRVSNVCVHVWLSLRAWRESQADRSPNPPTLSAPVQSAQFCSRASLACLLQRLPAARVYHYPLSCPKQASRPKQCLLQQGAWRRWSPPPLRRRPAWIWRCHWTRRSHIQVRNDKHPPAHRDELLSARCPVDPVGCTAFKALAAEVGADHRSGACSGASC